VNGTYTSVAGLPNSKLPPAGQAFVKAFSASEGGAAVTPYAVYAAQAAQNFIAAIAASDGTRAGINDQIYKTHAAGVLGNVAFNSNGDVTANSVTIYKAVKGQPVTYKVIVPPNSLVATA
jgi:ABC-type branched-subunit amino acid transport system substrate-binding protein